MKRNYSIELLAPLVKDSVSVQAICRKLNLRGGSANIFVRDKIKAFGLDTSHFTGTNKIGCRKQLVPDELVFCEHSTFLRPTSLRRRMLQTGEWKYECVICELKEWRGKLLTLHIDHINGIHNDNRKSNLRFLCPNCHQQTETWGNTKEVIK